MARIGWGGLVLGGVLIGSAAVLLSGDDKPRPRKVPPRGDGRGDRFVPPPEASPPAVIVPPPEASPPAAAPEVNYPPMSGAPVVYTAASFQPIVHRLIAAEFPRVNESVAMKWGSMESDWNPAAVGNPGQLAADGSNPQPREIGLGQIYNPDDFRAFKADPAAFRAYAPDAAPLAHAYNAAHADLVAAKKAGKSDSDPVVVDAQHRMAVAARTIQTLTRPLTADEMEQSVRVTLLLKVAHSMTTADHAVAAYSLSHWSIADYYKLVKSVHALPAVLNNGMPAVVKKLGRSPVSWAEFRTVLGMNGDAGWNRVLNNCEACGNAAAPVVA